MIMYHGTNIDIQQIDLNQCRPCKDFVKGFYFPNVHQTDEPSYCRNI
jgi:hypothetical protein